MPLRTIKHRAFTYSVDAPDPVDPKGEKRVLMDRVASRGDRVELREVDIERGERFSAFLSEDEVPESPVESSGDPEHISAKEMSVEDLSAWIKTDSPKVPEVVDAAEGDPDTAAKLLDAETDATGGHPRPTVVSGLEEVAKRQA